MNNSDRKLFQTEFKVKHYKWKIVPVLYQIKQIVATNHV